MVSWLRCDETPARPSHLSVFQFVSSRGQGSVTSMVSRRLPDVGRGWSTSLDLRSPANLTLDGGDRSVGRQAHSGLQYLHVGKLFWPDEREMADAGYAAVRDVPVLFDADGGYRRAANRYLRERKLVDWVPAQLAIGHTVPRKRTLENMARHLDDFLDWCAAARVDWTTISYGQLTSDYQAKLESGEIADSGRRLANGTVNARMDVATTFLCWAGERGLRPPFEIPLVTRRRAFTSGGRRTVASIEVRKGRLREGKPDTLGSEKDLPREDGIRDWLMAVRGRRGFAKHLICRVVIETGVRLDEAVALTVDQWPTVDAIQRCGSEGHDTVPMRLTQTKGGAPRTIAISVGFAHMVRRWIDGHRMRLSARWRKSVTGRATPEPLFLSDRPGHLGTPIKRHTVYDLFHEVAPRPRGWSPHMGRHAYACHFLLYFLRTEARLTGAAMTTPWVEARGSFALTLLRQQLGHVDESTTVLYLKWLRSALGLAQTASSWHEFLSGGRDD